MKLIFIKIDQVLNFMLEPLLGLRLGDEAREYNQSVTLLMEGAQDRTQNIVLFFKENRDEGVVFLQNCTEQEARARVDSYLDDQFVNYIELKDYNGMDWQEPARHYGLLPENYSRNKATIAKSSTGVNVTYHKSSDGISPPFVLYTKVDLNSVKKKMAKSREHKKASKQYKLTLDEVTFPIPDHPDRFTYEGADFVRVDYKLPSHGSMRAEDFLPYLNRLGINYFDLYFAGGTIDDDGCVLPVIINKQKVIVLFNAEPNEAMREYLLARANNQSIVKLTSGSQNNSLAQEPQSSQITAAEVSPSDIGLFHAAEAGDLPTVNQLLANEARVTYCNAAGNNAIHVAILMGHSEVALCLLDQAHRDINQRNKDGQTYVMCAASREDVKTLEQLIKMGADLEAADREGRRAIMFAISAGDKSWVAFRKLLNAGVNLNATDKRGFSSIDYAAGLVNRGSANGIIILRWLMGEDAILQAGSTNLLLQLKLYCILNKTKIAKKLQLGQPRDELALSFLDRDTERLGLCDRLSEYWLQCIWGQFNGAHTNATNPFTAALDCFSTWDGVSPLSDEKLELVGPFVKWMVSNKKAELDAPRILEGHPKELDFTAPATTHLKAILPEIVRENSLVWLTYLSGKESKETGILVGHAVGLYRYQDHYYYYDTNQHASHWVVCPNADSMVNILLRDVPDIISFQVYGDSPPMDENQKRKLLDIAWQGVQGKKVNYWTLLANSIDDKISFQYYMDKLRNSNEVLSSDNPGVRRIVKLLIIFPETLQVLLEKGIGPDILLQGDVHPIHVAAANGHLESVKLLLRYNANINQLDPNGQTALIFAIWFDHREIAKLLISAGADCNHVKPDGWTALMLACEKGQLDVVDCLIKAGAKLNIATDECVTALCVACTNGHVAVVKRLLDAGAYKTPDSSAAFFQKWLNPRDFAVREGHQEVVDLLDEYLRNQQTAASNSHSVTQELKSSKTSSSEVTELDLDLNPELDLDLDLFHAAEEGDFAAVNQLLAKGAGVSDKYNAIHIALSNQHLEIARFLLAQRHTDVNHKDPFGQTYLMYAASRDYTRILIFLTDMGADLDIADDNGKTALMLAISDRVVKSPFILISLGANINALDKHGQSAIDYAASLSCKENELGKDLLKCLMDKNAIIKQGSTNLELQLKLYCILTKTKIGEKLGLDRPDQVAERLLYQDGATLGVCDQLTGYWLRSMSEQFDSGLPNPANTVFEFFSKWDGVSPVSHQELELIAPFVKWMISKKGSMDEQISSINGKPKVLDLTIPASEKLKTLLPEIVKENSMVWLRNSVGKVSKENKIMGHAVGLYRFKGNYYYYNPNIEGIYSAICLNADLMVDTLLRDIPKENNQIPVLQFEVYGWSRPMEESLKRKFLDIACQGFEGKNIDYYQLLASSIIDEVSAQYYTDKLRESSEDLIFDSPYFRALLKGLTYLPGTLRLLLQKGLDPDISLVAEERLIHIAAFRGRLASVKELILGGASINIQDKTGMTALMAAVFNDHREIANLLIASRADCNKTLTTDGATALMMASHAGNLDMVDVLIKAGANVNLATNKCVTALSTACEKGHVAIVKRLLEAGADYKVPNSSAALFKASQDPRDIAVKNGHNDIVDLLDEYLRNQSSAQTSQKGLSGISE